MSSQELLLLLNLAVFGAAVVVSGRLTHFLIGAAQSFNMLDYPTERKNHKIPMPFLGGVSLFLTFWGLVFSGLVFAYFFKQRFLGAASFEGLLAGIVSLMPKIAGIFSGSLIVLAVGLLDDKFRWSPLQKLAGQCVAAVILMRMGLTINLVDQLGVLGYAITFVWILLIINSFNLVDYLDGHCAGIALISSVVFFWLTQILGQHLVGLFLIAFAGALLGFLVYNFNPARIYLGDNGSLFIGYLMASFTLLCRYQAPDVSAATIFIPVLMFGVPIYDTLSVTVLRLVRGVPPWRGDRNHFAHRLVKIGLSDRVAVLLSYFISLTVGFVAILMTQVTSLGTMLIALVFCCIIGIVILLEWYAAKGGRLTEGRF
jgi:UDP-GlcNAc:undecaprenyl-phosphate GlcNAc-1-phosphate transferase